MMHNLPYYFLGGLLLFGAFVFLIRQYYRYVEFRRAGKQFADLLRVFLGRPDPHSRLHPLNYLPGVSAESDHKLPVPQTLVKVLIGILIFCLAAFLIIGLKFAVPALLQWLRGS